MKNKETHQTEKIAVVVIRCPDLDTNLGFFEQIGFCLESIFPADNPREAILKGFGIRLCLKGVEAGPDKDSTVIRIEGDEAGEHTAPCGATVVFTVREAELKVPKPFVSFSVNSPVSDVKWEAGRAGMHYRDLIPGRLGGFLIASQIHIEEEGPVPDYVHYHDVLFQIIYCIKGWARLVYEDQGESFILEAGDCVLQSRGIRHRVLESSQNLEVFEITCPAEHVTYRDHEMTLPNGIPDPHRLYDGQKFVWSRASDAEWCDIPGSGMKYRGTGIEQASNGEVDVRILRRAGVINNGLKCQHNSITLIFVLSGMCSIAGDGYSARELKTGDNVTIPPNTPFVLDGGQNNLELLEIRVSPNS